MVRYILKRLLLMIPVILLVAIVIFTILYFVPGDPAAIILGSTATMDEINALRETMGLNDPYLVQLGRFMSDVFLHFNFGESYVSHVLVTTEIMKRFPRTLCIALACIALSIVVGVPLGINAAIHQDGPADRLSMFLALIGVSMPSFWLALLLVILFAVKLNWLPANGIGSLRHYILPVVANSFGGIASQARQSRSSMLEVIRSDYITTARAKGITERAVIMRHALPNALLPIITVAGTSFGSLMGGTLVIESVFSIPGIGYYMISAINNRDYPVVRGCVIFLAVMFSLIMLLTDLCYSFADPRIKAQYEGKKIFQSKRKKGEANG